MTGLHCIVSAALLTASWLEAYPDTASIDAREETAYFAQAEQRFRPVDPAWFYETQSVLRAEVRRVSEVLEASGQDHAQQWKQHLRWNLLEKSVELPLPGNLEELALVRRWLYSNKPGIESARFAELRRLVDAHLDAVLAFSYDDLRSEASQSAVMAAELCRRLEASPNELDASALGKLLGWFEKVRQFPDEVARVRSRFSSPNVEFAASDSFIRRATAAQMGAVTETIPLRERSTAPRTRRLQRERALAVRGTAVTEGVLSLNVVENNELAEIDVIYRGGIEAAYQADAGPVVLHMRSSGDAVVTKPIYFGPEGLDSGPVEVDQRIRSWLAHVAGESPLVRRVADRRARHPVSRSAQQSEARATSFEQLEDNMNQQVSAALRKFRAESDAARRSLEGFGSVAAPLEREAAVPYFHSARTTTSALVLGVLAASRDQLGAVVSPPPSAGEFDLTARFHISALNNPLETMIGGKRLNDEFFMKYGEIIHAELPLPLMVHSRARRWAVWTRKQRPLILRIPQKNCLEFVMTVESVEIDDSAYHGAARLLMPYRLEENVVGDVYLKRIGDIQVETDLPAPARELLKEKFGALFGPTITGGGVILPSGGLVGILRNLEVVDIEAKGEWLAANINVPQTVVDDLNRWRQENTNESVERN